MSLSSASSCPELSCLLWRRECLRFLFARSSIISAASFGRKSCSLTGQPGSGPHSVCIGDVITKLVRRFSIALSLFGCESGIHFIPRLGCATLSLDQKLTTNSFFCNSFDNPSTPANQSLESFLRLSFSTRVLATQHPFKSTPNSNLTYSATQYHHPQCLIKTTVKTRI